MRCSSRVDAGYSHEFTTAQVDKFLVDEYGADYKVAEPDEVRRVRGPPDLRDRRRRRWRSSPTKIEKLRELQQAFAAKTGVRNYCARRRRVARHLPPGRARAVHRSGRLRAGDRLATPAWAARRARSRGASARPSTRRCCYWGFTPLAVPESIRFELTGKLRPGVVREGRDAPHPRDVREARGHARTA